LFLTCLYKNRMFEFSVGAIGYLVIFMSFLFLKIPEAAFNGIQIGASLSCNYAQIPQIFMNWRLKAASWSFISAFLSTVGNLAKIFTTIQLTNDMLICFGHVLGALTNGVLLYQIIVYGKS